MKKYLNLRFQSSIKMVLSKQVNFVGLVNYREKKKRRNLCEINIHELLVATKLLGNLETINGQSKHS